MTSLYSKGTLVWISQPQSGWVAGTVESLDLPTDGDSSSEVVMIVSHDSDPTTSETLKFPLSTLQSATTDPTSLRTTTSSSGQDYLPALRNPPALETAEDLANLSNLNEPSGECNVLMLSSVLADILPYKSCMQWLPDTCSITLTHTRVSSWYVCFPVPTLFKT